MKIGFNTMVKNEAKLLNLVLPIWKTYPIDLFIFYDDNSTDNTCEVIRRHLHKEKFLIINDKLPKFNEGYQRQKMIDESIKNKVDFIFCLDADELLTSNIIKDFDTFIDIYKHQDMWLFWYNTVNDNLMYYRNDPLYSNNFRSFVLPVKSISNLDTNAWQYHTPRTPNVNLPKIYTKKYGVIHLQASNKKFYAIKQLWYKHYEFVNYNHSVEFINNRYDSVINNLNFNESIINPELIDGIDIDLSVFEGLENEKGYKDFILNNYNEKLITFGKEFL
jgi:hypothetical protein